MSCTISPSLSALPDTCTGLSTAQVAVNHHSAASAAVLVFCIMLQGTLLAQFKQEAKARMSVLQKLNHINKEGTVLLKGRAACEIDTTDELLSTGELPTVHNLAPVLLTSSVSKPWHTCGNRLLRYLHGQQRSVGLDE